MNTEVLQLEPNVPATVSLKYPQGKPCKNGRMFYTLTDGRSMFLPPYVDQKIQEARIRAGQDFQIVMKGEPGKATDYEVKPLAPPREPEVKLAGIQPSPLPVPANLMTGQSQYILAQVIAAIEVVHAAETYAVRIGRPVQFSAGDVRAIAISCFISQSREVCQ